MNYDLVEIVRHCLKLVTTVSDVLPHGLDAFPGKHHLRDLKSSLLLLERELSPKSSSADSDIIPMPSGLEKRLAAVEDGLVELKLSLKKGDEVPKAQVKHPPIPDGWELVPDGEKVAETYGGFALDFNCYGWVPVSRLASLISRGRVLAYIKPKKKETPDKPVLRKCGHADYGAVPKVYYGGKDDLHFVKCDCGRATLGHATRKEAIDTWNNLIQVVTRNLHPLGSKENYGIRIRCVRDNDVGGNVYEVLCHDGVWVPLTYEDSWLCSSPFADMKVGEEWVI